MCYPLGLVPYLTGQNLRWIYLIPLVLLALFKAPLKKIVNQGLFLVIFANVLWGVSSTIWSENYMISLMKGGVAAVCALSALIVGWDWARRKQMRYLLDLLAPAFVLIYLAGFLGIQKQMGYLLDFGGQVGQVYVLAPGLNPNAFGILVVMVSILPLWRFYLSLRGTLFEQMIWGAGSAIAIYFCLSSNARAALVALSFVFLGGLLAMGMRQRYQIFLGGVVVLAMLWSAQSLTIDYFVDRYVYKGSNAILMSRESVWKESFDMAKKGGLVGIGYGLTYGLKGYEFQGQLSMGFYREKGNSQLAIMEELGVVGLALYILMFVVLMATVWRTFQRCRDRDAKLMIGLLVGITVGLMAHSVFEAWWTAPGSSTFIFYWAVLGLLMGVLDRVRAAQRRQPVTYAPPRSPLYPVRPMG
ncbi:O-antigen ligase family protein [Magnetofaba australis]|uniref:Putative O-antigen polymerase n=1 Tax=Magnetofaba australis IT-1 TaxID=1434232 RepID=A0A1Y2K2D8_9PROT|nr:O-antigen ligase family protein [Magnetofaba australis]OSM02132.1 putative O-antigen polymerase [Magnetofaba australis IT-1]